MSLKYKTGFMAVALILLQPAYSANPEWDQATALFNNKNYTGALSALRKLADKSPRDASIHYMIGRCYKELNKPTQAKAEFEWVSKYAPDSQTKAMAAAMLGQGLPASGAGVVFAMDTTGVPGKSFINDSPSQTISAAAKQGWRPCNGGCLTVATQGWQHKKIEGHPDSDMWMTYTHGDCYNQFHIGHIIKDDPKTEKAIDTGACSRCNGTGWIKG